MTIAEAEYPGYSASLQPISDLGATCKTITAGISPLGGASTRVCNIYYPSAAIFDVSVFLLGLLAFVGGYGVLLSVRKSLGAVIMLSAAGVMGVAVFPETTGFLHTIVSFIAFFFGGIGAVLSFRSARPPISYLFVVLGVVTLVSLTLYASDTYLGLGQGEMERLVAYPTLLATLAFGAYLTGRGEESEVDRESIS